MTKTGPPAKPLSVRRGVLTLMGALHLLSIGVKVNVRRSAMDAERNEERESSTGGGAPGMREIRMEDYSHDDSDPSLTGVEGPAATAGQPGEAQQSNVGGAQSGGPDVEERARKGGYSGGTEGMHKGGHEGEMFGEFDNTGTGTDLTVEMMNTDARGQDEEGDIAGGLPEDES